MCLKSGPEFLWRKHACMHAHAHIQLPLSETFGITTMCRIEGLREETREHSPCFRSHLAQPSMHLPSSKCLIFWLGLHIPQVLRRKHIKSSPYFKFFLPIPNLHWSSFLLLVCMVLLFQIFWVKSSTSCTDSWPVLLMLYFLILRGPRVLRVSLLLGLGSLSPHSHFLLTLTQDTYLLSLDFTNVALDTVIASPFWLSGIFYSWYFRKKLMLTNKTCEWGLKKISGYRRKPSGARAWSKVIH